MNSQVSGGGLGQVVARDAVPAERVGQTGDLVPVELDAGADDEEVVAQHVPVAERDRLDVRVDRGSGLADPLDSLGHHVGLLAGALLDGRAAAADQGPQGLVVVRLGRVDEGDVGLACMSQPGRNRDAGAAAPEDDDLVVGPAAR